MEPMWFYNRFVHNNAVFEELEGGGGMKYLEEFEGGGTTILKVHRGPNIFE